MKTTVFANVINFAPSRIGVVYVFFCASDKIEIPFYVGETHRFAGRMDDYGQANFKAQTDFKVGEAIQYLRDTMKYRVRVAYQECENCRKEEDNIINLLRARGFRLLNDLAGYDYRSADEMTEREKVQKFCATLIAAIHSV